MPCKFLASTMASTEPVETNWNPIQASYIITLNIYILVENQYTQHAVYELPAKIPCTLLGDIIGICDQKVVSKVISEHKMFAGAACEVCAWIF